MFYKVPMPTKTNGVKLHTLPNNQIVVEYERGEPHVGPLAYDSSCGILSRNVTFQKPRKDARDALPPDTGIQRSKGAMQPRGSMNINDEDPDEDGGGGDEIATKLMSYLNDKLTPEQLSSVAAILGSGDDPPDSDAGEPRQAIDRRREVRLARDAARRRPMSAEQDAEFLRMFPNAGRLLLR
jgi:hypothetical protein